MKKLISILILFIILISGLYFFQTNNNIILNQTSITPTSITQKESTEDQIIEALYRKNNWEASKVAVKITSIECAYAKGLVNFKDEMSGGIWFAAKTATG